MSWVARDVCPAAPDTVVGEAAACAFTIIRPATLIVTLVIIFCTPWDVATQVLF